MRNARSIDAAAMGKFFAAAWLWAWATSAREAEVSVGSRTTGAGGGTGALSGGVSGEGAGSVTTGGLPDGDGDVGEGAWYGCGKAQAPNADAIVAKAIVSR